MARQVEGLSGTYIASLADDTGPLPNQIAALQTEPTWTVVRIRGGHWPMVANPDQIAGLLAAAADQGMR
jgi:hypothetical protein